MASDQHRFVVVVNEEEQHALWPAWKALPQGWSRTGFSGNQAECLGYVDRVWADMRPASVRTPREPIAPR